MWRHTIIHRQLLQGGENEIGRFCGDTLVDNSKKGWGGENEIHIVSMGVWSEVGMGAEGILERGDLSVYLSIYIYSQLLEEH